MVDYMTLVQSLALVLHNFVTRFFIKLNVQKSRTKQRKHFILFEIFILFIIIIFHVCEQDSKNKWSVKTICPICVPYITLYYVVYDPIKNNIGKTLNNVFYLIQNFYFFMHTHYEHSNLRDLSPIWASFNCSYAIRIYSLLTIGNVKKISGQEQIPEESQF